MPRSRAPGVLLRRQALTPFRPDGGADIGRQHALFNQFVRFITHARRNAFNFPFRIADHGRLNHVEINRAAARAPAFDKYRATRATEGETPLAAAHWHRTVRSSAPPLRCSSAARRNESLPDKTGTYAPPPGHRLQDRRPARSGPPLDSMSISRWRVPAATWESRGAGNTPRCCVPALRYRAHRQA